jgi:hypothetical protein
MAKTVIALSLALLLSACANGPCRQLRHPELAGPGQGAAPATPTEAKKPDAAPTAPASTVLIYKEDGSLQCKAAKGLSLEEMEKQLAPIKVYSRDKRDDGLMHIQVCGSPTGMINVYEIPGSAQKDAEKKGFKILDHR